MFCPKKRLVIGMLTLLAGLLIIPNVFSQSSSPYDARMKAMRAARERAQRPAEPAGRARIGQVAYQQSYDYSAPPLPQINAPTQRVARLPQNSQRSRNSTTRAFNSQAGRSRGSGTRGAAPGSYTPNHLRTAQVSDPQIQDGGSTIVENGNSVSPTPIISRNSEIYSESFEGGFVEGEIIGDGYIDGGYIDGGYGVGGCGTGGCGLNGLLCRQCVGVDDSCYGRGGCPPGTLENCWLFGLGDIFARGEYFMGASSFKGSAFQLPNVNDQIPDNNFGFYGGFNLGIPLCKLTCGLVSAQVGLRSVSSDYNGNSISPNTRDQVFVTAGLYRRVDYGFQAGFVVDTLREEWFTISDTAQVRVDLGWVYLNGTTLGIRFASNNTNDVTTGVVNGTNLTDIVTSTYDHARFYYRYDCPGGGFTELHVGSADNSRGFFGFRCDVPMGERLAVQTGVNYIIAESIDGVGGTDSDSWNLYMGFSFRPRGIGWYKNYDRPLFDVADNGSYLLRRF